MQHGAEFVADLLVDQGDDLGMGNHLGPSVARKAIAMPFSLLRDLLDTLQVKTPGAKSIRKREMQMAWAGHPRNRVER